MNADSPDCRRFAVALSFPGDHRDKVGPVAEHLAATFTEDRVLYDKFHDAEFARLDLDVYLPALYRTDSELIVIFLCPQYASKRWCKLEWRYIRQLIATADQERIMFLSFGNPGDLSETGVLSGDGYIDISDLKPHVVAEKILKRLSLNQGIAPSTKKHSPASTATGGFDISRIIKYAPEKLIGREAETKILDDAWDKARRAETGRPQVLTFVALGGEGKTSLVAKWVVNEIQAKGWPDCDAAFAWSFYSQGTKDQTAASSDLFLKEALVFFGDPETAESPLGAFEKGKRLAKLAGEKRALLILDGLEPLQYPPSSPLPGQLRDQGVAALLKDLAGSSQGLCIVTTRFSLPDLKAYHETTAPEIDLKRLSPEAGAHLLKSLGVAGAQTEFEKLVEDVKGHALTLTLLGGFLKRAFKGDIRCRDRVKFEKADEKIDGGHAFRTMAAYEKWLLQDGGDEGRREVAVLRLMGLFDRPADAGCLKALRSKAIPGLTEALAGLAEDDWEFCLTGLETAKLLTVNRDAYGALTSLDAHPHLREYFAKQLREDHAEAWKAGHKRLYVYLCETTPDKPQPTLEDLQPLYQAVAHGCLAGLQQEACVKVYWNRILRGQRAYSTKNLGAFGSDLGAAACFFEEPWRRVSLALTEADQAWLLSDAAFSLRALGRLTEALEPMRAGLDMGVQQEEWAEAARRAGNLSELELTLGEVDGAVKDGEQSVAFADRSGNEFQRMSKRTTHADALHQAGQQEEAEALFREAEKIQAEDQPDYPLLYSVQGFRYCDLLLSEAEQAAWQEALSPASLPLEDRGGADCRDVEQRAAQTFNWIDNDSSAPIFTIAVEHLTLGRAALYRAILERLDLQNHASGLDHIDKAVDDLRRAGDTTRLPFGLLTRAWFRFLTGRRTGPESSQADLDEAWEIAERGPMPLHMADIRLHRARLFFREASYPWQSPEHDLEEARGLIEKCGYGRRMGELEDAEKVIL